MLYKETSDCRPVQPSTLELLEKLMLIKEVKDFALLGE